MTDIAQNVADVRARICAACKQAGRDPREITLLAAVKYADEATLTQLLATDIDGVAENRVQQLLDRIGRPDYMAHPVHFIGSLQTNKVKYIVDKVQMIHSLDSVRLAAEIEKQCAARGITMDVLAEINSGREVDKGGLMPEDAADFCLGLGTFPHLRLCGFMTMAPKCEQKAQYYKYFSETYSLSLDIWREKLHNNNRFILSMGMSDSFEEAIACGATHVRVGHALFAQRQPEMV